MGAVRYTLYSGTMAGLACLATLMVMARSEGRGALQPINATSHWVYGDTAGSAAHAEPRRTGLGIATNLAAAIFWATPFAIWLAGRPPRRPLRLLCEASILSAFAAFFDYMIVPKRLTPGWELAVSRRSVAVTFAAMAVGLAAGAWAAQSAR